MRILLEEKPLDRLTIDLYGITFASPSGIEALLDATEECRRIGIEFDLVSNRRVNRTLELLGYDWLVDVPDIIGVENSMMRTAQADEDAREPD